MILEFLTKHGVQVLSGNVETLLSWGGKY